jgi:hypothetical protein
MCHLPLDVTYGFRGPRQAQRRGRQAAPGVSLRAVRGGRAPCHRLLACARQRLEPAGGFWGMFGWHTVPPPDANGAAPPALVITEGEFDAMAAHVLTVRRRCCASTPAHRSRVQGLPAVSLPNGASSLPVEILPRLEPFPKVCEPRGSGVVSLRAGQSRRALRASDHFVDGLGRAGPRGRREVRAQAGHRQNAHRACLASYRGHGRSQGRQRRTAASLTVVQPQACPHGSQVSAVALLLPRPRCACCLLHSSSPRRRWVKNADLLRSAKVRRRAGCPADCTCASNRTPALRLAPSLSCATKSSVPCRRKRMRQCVCGPSPRHPVRDGASPQGHTGIELKGLPLLNGITKARPDSSGRLRALSAADCRRPQGFRPGELTVVTGSVGVGKSTFLSQLALEICGQVPRPACVPSDGGGTDILRAQGVPTLFGSFEHKDTHAVRSSLLMPLADAVAGHADVQAAPLVGRVAAAALL